MEIIARQNCVEGNSRNSSDGQRGEGDGYLTDVEGQSIRKAQTAHQNDGGNDQVPGVGEVHLVLHHIAHADGRDHTVENEADAADDGRGDGADEGGEQRAEGEHDGIDRSQPDHPGIVDPGEYQHSGIFAVGSVGGTAEQTCKRGGDAVSDEGTVQAGIFNEVLAHRGGDGRHVADVLHHGGNGDGCHHQNGRDVELGDTAGEIGDEGLEAQDLGAGHAGEVQHGAGSAGGGIGDDRGAAGIGDHRHQIRAYNAQQDGNDLDHATAPDVCHHDDGHGHQGQPPAGRGVGDSGGGQVQSDEDDDGAGDHRRQEMHHPMHTYHFNDAGQHHIQKPRYHDAAAGVLELFRAVHTGVNSAVHGAHGGKTAQERKGRAQERRDPQLRAEVEKERADAGKKQRGLDRQRQSVGVDQNRHQYCSAEHGKHVLQAQNQHLRPA